MFLYLARMLWISLLRLMHSALLHVNEGGRRQAGLQAEERERERLKIPVFVCLMSQRLSLSGLPPSHISLPRLSAPPHAAAASTESWSLHGATRCWSEWAAVASRA